MSSEPPPAAMIRARVAGVRPNSEQNDCILTFLQELDTNEVGTHILEGVGKGMTAAGWDSDAETVASNLEAALNMALDIGKVVNVTADESVMVDGKIDMSKVNAIAFDPYTHGYYKVTERVGEAFRDGLKLKK